MEGILGDALELALVLRFTVRLDGGMHTVHGHAAVKTGVESEQSRELERVPRERSLRLTPPGSSDIDPKPETRAARKTAHLSRNSLTVQLTYSSRPEKGKGEGKGSTHRHTHTHGHRTRTRHNVFSGTLTQAPREEKSRETRWWTARGSCASHHA